jgi:hypothetical protein
VFLFLQSAFFLWHETQFSSKFGAKLSLPCPFFSWTLSTNHCCPAMCTVAIKVLEPGPFNAESQYFIPLFNRISWLCGQHLRGYEASTQAQQGMTFQITLIFTFYFLPWERDPSENVRTDPILRLDAKWEPGRFSPSIRFSSRFLAENRRQFSAGGWEPPNTGKIPWSYSTL